MWTLLPIDFARRSSFSAVSLNLYVVALALGEGVIKYYHWSIPPLSQNATLPEKSVQVCTRGTTVTGRATALSFCCKGRY